MLSTDKCIPFDFNMPIYNWFYPMSYQEIKVDKDTINSIFNQEDKRVTNRALYFHIPFCQDICSFCPFTREVLKSDSYLDRYVDALIKEIQMKARYPYISNKPITAIFFGGGTPSILKPKHIRKIGQAIHDNFDLSQIKEFSFEMNAKTVLPERIEALKEIGVTHGRMGVQTFNPDYREMFKLTATLQNIYDGAKLLNSAFDNVCIDMLYGMHGQSLSDIVRDMKQAMGLGTSHMDVYPINNGVIQKRLKDEYLRRNYKASTGLDKYLYNIVIYEYLKRNGFDVHNGHGYFRTNKSNKLGDFVNNNYTFQYHESVYGYSGHEIIAFGPVGYSVLNEYVVGNLADIRTYIETVEGGNLPIAGVGIYPRELTEIKGITLHLPYHGVAYKSQIDFNYVNSDLLEKINNLIKFGMVIEHTDRYALTQLGWYNYVNLLFYLSPQCEQDSLMKYIKDANIIDDFVCTLDF